jgi:hypothetical protein
MELVCYIVGVIIGVLVTNILWWRKECGTLEIDQTDPEVDAYQIRLKDYHCLLGKNKIVLSVVHISDNSQE